ncbi:MAG: hypothetical protein IT381_26930 [Deltaproteobacteria bacterium]|nr:hypothetical protein [Deltaproteobacteria bacterium]
MSEPIGKYNHYFTATRGFDGSVTAEIFTIKVDPSTQATIFDKRTKTYENAAVAAYDLTCCEGIPVTADALDKAAPVPYGPPPLDAGQQAALKAMEPPKTKAEKKKDEPKTAAPKKAGTVVRMPRQEHIENASKVFALKKTDIGPMAVKTGELQTALASLIKKGVIAGDLGKTGPAKNGIDKDFGGKTMHAYNAAVAAVMKKYPNTKSTELVAAIIKLDQEPVAQAPEVKKVEPKKIDPKKPIPVKPVILKKTGTH